MGSKWSRLWMRNLNCRSRTSAREGTRRSRNIFVEFEVALRRLFGALSWLIRKCSGKNSGNFHNFQSDFDAFSRVGVAQCYPCSSSRITNYNETRFPGHQSPPGNSGET